VFGDSAISNLNRMTGHVIFPPSYIVELQGPVIFLAGPIQGAPDWQTEAIRLLQAAAPDIHLASPRRGPAVEEFDYTQQVNWETYHLKRAGQHGAILFWLAKEAVHLCERAYAQTSRFELGEWKVKHERDGVKLIVGIDEGFTNSRYIRHRLTQDCPNVPICRSLAETCQEAIRAVRRLT
jgi:hypothetical protein